MPGSDRQVAGEVWSHERLATEGESKTGPSVAALNLQLLASLNHEIRTPLSGILGMTDLLLESGLNGEQEEYVSAARECAEALFDLLNATLEYSSLQAGCIRLDTSEFRLGDLLDGVLGESGARARVRGMELRTHLGPGLDKAVVGDAHRIRQVMAQILNSVIRFGSGNWLDAHVTVDPESDRAAVLTFEVACDEMAPDSAGVASGAGLAFAVVEGLVRLLGGQIDPRRESETGGYRLAVHLPLNAAPAHGGHQAAREAGRPLRPPRILVVDDNRISQQVIGALLSKGGWQFDTAPDGFAALDAAASNSYQLILMDLQMPGMDGLEATARLRQMPDYSDTPVLALTADVTDLVRAKCRDAGMNAFLEKPIHTVQLNAMLGQFLTSPDGD
ncbi:MAG TPA: response regulator [Bryobacteraceae bacterium]|nr:response regulator [Bryobacteraceae bacterium]HPT28052.1 response regulator [Bryobacteraceae bacterium]